MTDQEPKVVFNPLDRDADFDVTTRNLPHWFQVDAAIFVTFRTHDSIQHGNRVLYDSDSFIVMPNHVHALVQFRQDAGLEIVSQSWMLYSARLINKATGQSGPFWQPEPFDISFAVPNNFAIAGLYR